MKTFKFAFVALTVLFNFSCGTSDDGNQDMQDTGNYAELILGKWEHSKVLIDGVETQEACRIDVSYTYGDDGFYGIILGEKGLCAPTGGTGIYEVIGNKVFLNSAQGDIRFEYTIETLNANEFSYVLRYEDADNFPEVHTITAKRVEE